jgi:hypothetical protein
MADRKNVAATDCPVGEAKIPVVESASGREVLVGVGGSPARAVSREDLWRYGGDIFVLVLSAAIDYLATQVIPGAEGWQLTLFTLIAAILQLVRKWFTDTRPKLPG